MKPTMLIEEPSRPAASEIRSGAAQGKAYRRTGLTRNPLDETASGQAGPAATSAASFPTVFQFRPVPRVPSFFSIMGRARRERPTPSG